MVYIMENNYVPYGAMGFGKTIPQPKSTYDKVWSFGLGAAGGVVTAAWYTGYATSAIALGPVSVPVALGAGAVCFGYAVYSSVSEPKKHKMVLAGGSVGVASMSLGAVGFIMPKFAFGMTAVTGPMAVPLMIGGAIVYGIADHYDTDHKLEEAKPAFYGFAVGELSTYFCLKSNAEEITRAVEDGKMIGGNTDFVNNYHRAEKSVLADNGAFMNGCTFYKLVHETNAAPKSLRMGSDVVHAGEEFATQQSFAEHINANARDTFAREGRQSWAVAANNAAAHLADEGDASVDLLAGVSENQDGLF